MRGLVALLTLAVAINLAYGCGTNGKCPDDWIKKGDKCYKLFSKNPKTFDKAEEFCKTQGGHLACPENKAENTGIHEVVKNYGKRTWIGVQDKHHKGKKGKEGTFRCHGSIIKFKGWHKGEPNDLGNEDCTEVYFSDWGPSMTWNDTQCSQKQAFVCEFHKD